MIFLSFKNANHTTWKDMHESLYLTLKNEFGRHLNILDSEFVSDVSKAYFKRMLDGELSEVECQASLGQLSHMLSEACDSRVIIIIDEYDTPVLRGNACGYCNEVTAFMRNLLSSAFKDNPALELSVLAGTYCIEKGDLFRGMNNLSVNTILDEKYAEYFGFTFHDVEAMSSYYGQTEKLPEIREWYGGYMAGSAEIYNPRSVIAYFNNNFTPQLMQSGTAGNKMIHEVIRNRGTEMQDSLMKLLQDNTIRAVVDANIILSEIRSSEDVVYSFLLMNGYLSVNEIITTLDGNPVCSLSVPNKEIKSAFRKEILDILSKSIPQSVIRSIRLAVKSNNRVEFDKVLRQFLLQCAHGFNASQEDFHHFMMPGLLAIMSDDYYVSSDMESAEGRYDIQLRPISKQ